MCSAFVLTRRLKQYLRVQIATHYYYLLLIVIVFAMRQDLFPFETLGPRYKFGPPRLDAGR